MRGEIKGKAWKRGALDTEPLVVPRPLKMGSRQEEGAVPQGRRSSQLVSFQMG